MISEEILEKNRTFILERPVHNVTTFVYFDPNTKIQEIFNQEFSNRLDKIREISNLVFIFNNKAKGIINFENISTLYRACGYIVSDHDYLVQSLYYALLYFRTLYERHTGYLLLCDWEIKDIDLDKTRGIIYHGSLQSSIYKKERVPIEDLKEIFLIDLEKSEKQSFWEKIRGKVDLKYTSGMYSRYDVTIENKGIFLRPNFVDEMKKFIESEECPKYYLESFYTRWPGEFFCSIGEYMPENVKILDLKIESIDLR